jgi:hypothetical protein
MLDVRRAIFEGYERLHRVLLFSTTLFAAV